MRHGRKVNHLGRTSSHRKAMMANMACSLIEHKRINTTLAKAKALRKYVEPLLTKSKNDSTHARRTVFSYLQNKDVVAELFRDVAPKIAERNGGYTRILKTGHRLGDNAEMCFIELVDFNETYTSDKKEKKTTRRSRRGGSKPAAEKAPAAETAAVAEAEVIETPEAKAEVKTEAKAKAETKAESKAEVKSEAKVEAKAEAKAEEPKAEKKEKAAEEKKEAKTESEEKKDEEKSE